MTKHDDVSDTPRSEKGRAYAEALDGLLPKVKGALTPRRQAIADAEKGLPSLATYYARECVEKSFDRTDPRRAALTKQLVAVQMLIFGVVVPVYSPAEIKKRRQEATDKYGRFSFELQMMTLEPDPMTGIHRNLWDIISDG